MVLLVTVSGEFCSEGGIRRINVSNSELDRQIQGRVSVVDHTYGRRCMHSLLQAGGIQVCQRRVGESLRRTFLFQYIPGRAACFFWLQTFVMREASGGETSDVYGSGEICAPIWGDMTITVSLDDLEVS